MSYGRTDGNQPELVKKLRRIPGVKVKVTSQVRDGFPDLVVGYRGLNFLLEVKDESQPPSARRLTPDELEFAREHPVAVVCSARDALAVVGIEVA